MCIFSQKQINELLGAVNHGQTWLHYRLQATISRAFRVLINTGTLLHKSHEAENQNKLDRLSGVVTVMPCVKKGAGELTWSMSMPVLAVVLRRASTEGRASSTKLCSCGPRTVAW